MYLPRLEVEVDDDAQSSITTVRPPSGRLHSLSPTNAPTLRPSSAQRNATTSPKPLTRQVKKGGRPITPAKNIKPDRHASARVGTVFGGGGDITAFQREWQMAQDANNSGSEASSRQHTERPLVGEVEPVPSTELPSDDLTEAEWEERLGIRSQLAPVYVKREYRTVDEDLADWESSVRVQTASPAKGKRGASPTKLPSSPMPRLTTPNGRLPPVARSDSHLNTALDVERSGLTNTTLTSNPKVIPTLKFEQVAELDQRTLDRLPTPVETQQTHKTHRRDRSRTMESSREDTTAEIMHRPRTALVLPPDAPIIPAGSTASSAAMEYLDAVYAHSAHVLSPRSRYDQLSRACDQILPSESQFAPAVAQSPSLIPEPTKIAPKLDSNLTDELHKQNPNAPMQSHRTHTGATSTRFADRSAEATPISSRRSSRPGTAGNSRPGTASNGRRELSQALKRREKPNAHNVKLMRELKLRQKLSSEFLREVQSHDPSISGAPSGLALLSAAENDRLSTHRAKAAKILTVGGGGGGAEEKEYSSAAVLAARELHGLPPPGHVHPHPHMLPHPIHRSGSPHRHPKHIDPHLAGVAAAAHELHMVQSTAEPSPAIGQGHAFLNTYALHHHVRLGKKPKSKPLGVSASAPNLHRGEPMGDSNEPPLPSHSLALQLQSPSSKLGWTPPSLSCVMLAEKIYHTTRQLDGIISNGEGREQLERHLNIIKPAHLVEEARKKSLAAAAVSRMQSFAADQKARALKAKIDAGAAIVQARLEARMAAKRAKRESEKAKEAALVTELQEQAAKLEAEEKQATMPTTSTGAPPKGLTVAIGIGGPLPEEPLSVIGSPVSPPLSPSSPSGRDKRSSLWSRIRSLTTDGPLSPTGSSLDELSPEAKQKFKLEAARVNGGQTRGPPVVLARTPSVIAAAELVPEYSKAASFSVHRIPRVRGGSSFGPMGEDLTGQSLLTPASYAAGHMLDMSVSAADERHTLDEKKKLQQADYNAVLARLYQRVTPQQKRLRRLDQPKMTQGDLQRVVAESLGTYDPNAKKRFVLRP